MGFHVFRVPAWLAGGMVKGRLALLDLGASRPDLVDTGVRDWDEAAYGAPRGRQKPPMSFADQVPRLQHRRQGFADLFAFRHSMRAEAFVNHAASRCATLQSSHNRPCKVCPDASIRGANTLERAGE